MVVDLKKMDQKKRIGRIKKWRPYFGAGLLTFFITPKGDRYKYNYYQDLLLAEVKKPFKERDLNKEHRYRLMVTDQIYEESDHKSMTLYLFLQMSVFIMNMAFIFGLLFMLFIDFNNSVAGMKRVFFITLILELVYKLCHHKYRFF